MMTRARAREIVARFEGQRILAAGDLILDLFIWGNVSRISPEAPVPVVEVTRESSVPGGAANVARNLREFTSRVAVAGRVGDDVAGRELTGQLQASGIDTRGVCVEAELPTATKTRIVARNQQVVRIDREKRRPLDGPSLRATLDFLVQAGPDFDAVVVADYNKGFLSSPVVESMSALAAGGVRLAVDPHPGNPQAWRGATVVKPNYGEAFAFAGRPPRPFEEGDGAGSIFEVGRSLLEMWSSRMALVTLGEHGMLLFRPDRPPFHVPTRAREVFDVSGAGDTAIALLTLALVAGATPEEATEIANHASGVVVGKLGTATLTPDELVESFQ
jgi:D-beta-D-heptose 7-phosphate kinase/D-beta-D-heptose 1-phosphate adenosyltransferase